MSELTSKLKITEKLRFFLGLGFPMMMYAILIAVMPGQLEDVILNYSNKPIQLALSYSIPIALFALIVNLIAYRVYGAWSSLAFWLSVAPMPIVLLGTAFQSHSVLVPGFVVVASVTAGLWYFIVWVQKRSIAPQLWALFAGVAALYLLASVATQLAPVQFPISIGPVVILALSIGFLSVLFLAMLNSKNFSILVICCLAISLYFGNEHKLSKVDAASNDHNLYKDFPKWLAAREDLQAYKEAGRPYPVFLIASEGGGIYAAAHSYAVITQLQAFCPAFAQHVLAMTGTSGGSVGTVLAAAKLSKAPPVKELAHCKFSDFKPNHSVLGFDFLSPVFASLFFIEGLDFLLPGRLFSQDRGSALAAAIAASDPISADFLNTPLNGLWKPDGMTPILGLVTTDIETGFPVVLSTTGYLNTDRKMAAAGRFSFEYSIELSDDGESPTKSITLAHAASASSRFPWLTPSVILQEKAVQDETPLRYVLGDGGYVDNSSVRTVFEFANVIRILSENSFDEDGASSDEKTIEKCKLYIHAGPKMVQPTKTQDAAWTGCDTHISLNTIVISQALKQFPGIKNEIKSNPEQSFLFDPIKSLLSVRHANGIKDILDIRLEYCGNSACIVDTGTDGLAHFTGIFHYQLDVKNLNLPLGWSLSQKRIDAIYNHSANVRNCPTLKEDGNVLEYSIDKKNACLAALIATNFEKHLNEKMSRFSILNMGKRLHD